jgi:hypothetical protein
LGNDTSLSQDLVPPTVSKSPQTIWKYNALFHLTSEHVIDSTPPEIPRQLLADMHITRERKGLKEAADFWHDIPGTESVLEMMQAEEPPKRGDQTKFPQLCLAVMTQKHLKIYSIAV